MNRNILLCGVGGQGTVLASKMIAQAAMKKQIPVMSAETIGMAQRGGSVVSHVRLGDHLYAPMIEQGTADLILGFEPGETVRMLPYLAKGGFCVVSSHPVQPVTATLSESVYDGAQMIEYLKGQVANLIVVDTETACQELGSGKIVNMLLLGAAADANVLGFSMAEMEEMVAEAIAPKYQALNLRALNYVSHADNR